MKELFENYHQEMLSQNASQSLDLKNFELVARKFRWNYQRFFSQLQKDIKILDFGCGVGQFLFYLKKEGFQNITGIDISRSQIAIALRMQPDVNFLYFSDTVKFLQENKNTYDVIVINDVIEHFDKKEIIPFLKDVFQSLKSGGIVVIKTINSAYPLSNAARYLDFTHTVSFHEKALTQLLRHVGFSDISCYQEEIGTYNILFAIKKILVTIARLMIKVLIYLTESDWPRIISINLIATGKKS
uniref:class I SAM-dependent methyltransferase n=1 Tax=Candidatus Electronema sp. TaxID=2698783 RepID=UPI004056F560